MLLTEHDLRNCIPSISDRKIDKYLSPLNTTLEKYSINTPLRIAAFLAQVAHESGNFNYVEEIASGSAYEFRKDLGNLEFIAVQIAHQNHSTTGVFYKGRGLIQITGYYNYKACGEALGIDIIHSPVMLTDPLYATLSAGWFWDSHELNVFADHKTFDTITRRINGGLNGKVERDANYKRCLQVLVQEG
jgi:predicted chitinase